MKTEQEQIEKMARSMCGYCSTDGKCAVSKNGREPDICANVDTQHCLYREYAERLIENGYGDVSEYKAEIEDLKADFDSLQESYEFVRDCDAEHCLEINETVKQAKIDVLNKIKNCREATDSDCYPYLERIVNKLIKEIENDKCNC